MSNFDFETRMRLEMARGIIMRRIVCGVSGHVLDIDRDLIIVDSDGDPVDVVHHTVRPTLEREDVAAGLRAKGWSIWER